MDRLVLEEVPLLRPAEPPQEVPEQPACPQPFDWQAKTAVVAERNAPDPVWWEALEKITAPTLVIGGGESSHVPQAHLAELVERIPDACLVTVEVPAISSTRSAPGSSSPRSTRSSRRVRSLPRLVSCGSRRGLRRGPHDTPSVPAAWAHGDPAASSVSGLSSRARRMPGMTDSR